MIPPHPTYFPQKPRDLVNGAAYEKCLKIESALDVLNTPPVVRHTGLTTPDEDANFNSI
jgi:hypothetical protein